METLGALTSPASPTAMVATDAVPAKSAGNILGQEPPQPQSMLMKNIPGYLAAKGHHRDFGSKVLKEWGWETTPQDSPQPDLFLSFFHYLA
ncbi:hypothetical protein IHE44_0010199 [Lamprotornis superbus]|uniref:Uncharacterized protein n=1 Tax=Lamprotornis superbus TaxID=245042 RepID=A0A835TPW3_9PASS|nr:hypothetical protein IHE44_0010199 [Lamprotornis superbus]